MHLDYQKGSAAVASIFADTGKTYTYPGFVHVAGLEVYNRIENNKILFNVGKTNQ